LKFKQFHLIDDGVKSKGHRFNVLNPAHRCGAVVLAQHKKKGPVYIFTYAFYVSSLEKGDLIANQLDIWRAEDEKEAKEHGWDGKGSINTKISFEFPHLVKQIDIGK
jgi:hypothetical protein